MPLRRKPHNTPSGTSTGSASERDHARANISYRFRLDPTRDWAITCDQPFFAVTFGGKSYVTYADDHNPSLDLSAEFEADRPIVVNTGRFPDRWTVLPRGTSQEDYLALVKARIAAAATWRGVALIFRP